MIDVRGDEGGRREEEEEEEEEKEEEEEEAANCQQKIGSRAVQRQRAFWARYVPNFEAAWTSTWAKVASKRVRVSWSRLRWDGLDPSWVGCLWADLQKLQTTTVPYTFFSASSGRTWPCHLKLCQTHRSVQSMHQLPRHLGCGQICLAKLLLADRSSCSTLRTPHPKPQTRT